MSESTQYNAARILCALMRSDKASAGDHEEYWRESVALAVDLALAIEAELERRTQDARQSEPRVVEPTRHATDTTQ